MTQLNFFGIRTIATYVLLQISTIGLSQAGSLDTTFDTGTNFNNNWVASIAVQADGKVLAGGGGFAAASPSFLKRYNDDGSPDNDFNTSVVFNDHVWAVALQDDGKILVGGSFTNVNLQQRNRIVRLNADGTLDDTFGILQGFNATVKTIAVQSDGKILVGGNFTTYKNSPASRLIRLEANGDVDPTFTHTNTFIYHVLTVAVQSDGKILVGGEFNQYSSVVTGHFTRINADGTLDTAFNNNMGTGFSGVVESIAVQNDDKIIVGGWFTTFNGLTQRRIARLNSNGTLDSDFNIGTGFQTGVVFALSIQQDGKIVASGSFQTYNGTPRERIIRLNTDGSVDNSFDPGGGFQWDVYSTAIALNDKIYAGGMFNAYNGTPRHRIARLNLDDDCEPTTGTDEIVSCSAYTWINGVTYTESNFEDTFILISEAGCDSIVSLSLTIVNIDVNVESADNILTATASDATFQWINCENNTPIEGANDSSFFPSENGEYAVVVTQNTCVDTSSCVLFDLLELSESLLLDIRVFPNPSSGLIHVSLSNAFVEKFNIVDLKGRIIMTFDVLSSSSYSIDASTVEDGFYFLEIYSGAIVERRSIIIKH